MDASQSGLSSGSLGGPTTTNSGNPTYADASAGPQTTDVPNAKPYGIDDKKKKKLKLNPEAKKWQPGDPEIMYVKSPVPKQCGTCEYFRHPSICEVPPNGLSIQVDPLEGCCNKWTEIDP